MWEVIICQECENKLMDGTSFVSTQETEFMFCEFDQAIEFIGWALVSGLKKQLQKLKKWRKKNNEFI